MAKEIWKDIKGYEGYYQVSNTGKVRSLDRYLNDRRGFRLQKGKPKKIVDLANGYKAVSLYKNGKGKYHLLHRVIATAFIENTLFKPFINHIDGNKQNNHVENLEWCTNKENLEHASRMGLMCSGENHYNASLKNGDKSKIIQAYHDGVYQYVIARSFGITQSHVSRIVNGKEKRRA